MKSGLISAYHNYPDNFIDYPEDFCQNHIWLISEHEGKNTQKFPTQNSNKKLYVGSNSYMFIGTTMFT